MFPATKCHQAILSCTREANELESEERFIFLWHQLAFSPGILAFIYVGSITPKNNRFGLE
jgi:hypothetical protein